MVEGLHGLDRRLVAEGDVDVEDGRRRDVAGALGREDPGALAPEGRERLDVGELDPAGAPGGHRRQPHHEAGVGLLLGQRGGATLGGGLLVGVAGVLLAGDGRLEAAAVAPVGEAGDAGVLGQREAVGHLDRGLEVVDEDLGDGGARRVAVDDGVDPGVGGAQRADGRRGPAGRQGRGGDEAERGGERAAEQA